MTTKKQLRRFCKGERVIISLGAYSDYNIPLFGVTLESFCPNEIMERWLKENPKEREDFEFRLSAFLKWLVVDLKLIQEEETMEWYLGDYGAIEMRLDVHESGGA